MITHILNSFCDLLDILGASVYQMQKSEDAFKSVHKQITNKDMCGYQLVSWEIQSYTRHVHNTWKHKVPLQYIFPLVYRLALIYLAVLRKNITLIIFELLYIAIYLIHNFLFIYIDSVRSLVLFWGPVFL